MSFSLSRCARTAVFLVLCLLLGCEEVLVSAVPVASVEVDPSEVTMVVGEIRELDFVARGGGGELLVGRTVNWSIQNGQVAQVDGNGVLAALSPGETQVRARSEGVTGEGIVRVLSSPALELVPSTVSFAALEDQADPPPQTVTIGNAGSGTLAGLNTAIVYGEGQPGGWLRAELMATTSPTQLTLRAVIAQLPEGLYTSIVQVQSSNAINSPQTIQVSLTIGEEPPRIDLAPGTDVLLAGTEGATAPATIVLSLTNGGGGTLVDLAVTSVDYGAGEPTGWLAAELSASVAPTALFLRAHPGGFGGLSPGEYHATVTISAPGASNSPVTVFVTFEIT